MASTLSPMAVASSRSSDSCSRIGTRKAFLRLRLFWPSLPAGAAASGGRWDARSAFSKKCAERRVGLTYCDVGGRLAMFVVVYPDVLVGEARG